MFYLADDSLITDVLRPDSDLLNSISTLLNKKSTGVRNWRVLANKLGVSNEVYDEFDENRPRKSPTKMMLEWLNSERSGLTVEQLRTAVKEIGRADALEILDRFLSQQGNLTTFIKASQKKMMMIMTVRDEDNNGYWKNQEIWVENAVCFIIIST